MGFSFLATGTDLGLLGDAAAKNAAFARGLRGAAAQQGGGGSSGGA